MTHRERRRRPPIPELFPRHFVSHQVTTSRMLRRSGKWLVLGSMKAKNKPGILPLLPFSCLASGKNMSPRAGI